MKVEPLAERLSSSREPEPYAVVSARGSSVLQGLTQKRTHHNTLGVLRNVGRCRTISIRFGHNKLRQHSILSGRHSDLRHDTR